MKKTYMRPEGTVIQLCMEQHILDGSITANTSQADAEAKDGVSLNRPPRAGAAKAGARSKGAHQA